MSAWWRRERQRWVNIFENERYAKLQVSCAVALILRSLWMFNPNWDSIPVDARGYLIPANIPEHGWGLVLLTWGIGQLIALRSRNGLAEAMAATLIAMLQFMVLAAYWNGGAFNRAVVPLLIALMLDEMAIARHGWSQQQFPKVWLTERRESLRAQ